MALNLRPDHGYLYIVDRKKDMIITGGFNVFATEVEAPILAMLEVLECAVIGVPDEKWGESIKAIVVLKPGHQVTADEIMERCRAKLGAMKAPKSVELWDAIPKTAVGKTDKKVIRAKYWANAERAVTRGWENPTNPCRCEFIRTLNFNVGG